MTIELRYSLRVVRWAALFTVFLIALAINALLAVAGAEGSSLLAVAIVGGLAASAALGLDDPAYALLGPVPTGPARRVGARLLLLGPVAVAGLLVIDVVGEQLLVTPPAGLDAGPLVALLAVAVAVVAVVRRQRPELAAAIGAGVALAWAASVALVRTEGLADVATFWIDRPVVVLAVASVVTGVALRAR